MLPLDLFRKIVVSLFALEVCFSLRGSSSSPKNDLITSLPGQPPVGFKQYAGYVTVDDEDQRALFYYFVGAEINPQHKPLVLWLNGGPGCSSVGIGAFTEHGPFRPKGDGLERNCYSWNKEANMLYLESPAGVGFSYSSNKSFYSYINDEITARDNLAFLLKWLENYPEYNNRDFYITGENYGGHYVPQLASLVLNSTIKLNLKGIAIGNPLLEFNTDFNSEGEYLWSHGLISDLTFSKANSICNFSQIRRQQIEQVTLSPPCEEVAVQAEEEIGIFVDPHDIIKDVCLHPISPQAKALYRKAMNPNKTNKTDERLDDKTMGYLNRKDVQATLNAKLVGVNSWATCSGDIKYDRKELEKPSLPILETLLKSGVQVFIYSGDQDSVLPLIGTRTLVGSLAKKLGLKTSVPYKNWLQNNQVGGWTQVYGDSILSYATIRGASQEAPSSQPERSLALFRGFLARKPLSQPI